MIKFEIASVSKFKPVLVKEKEKFGEGGGGGSKQRRYKHTWDPG